MNMIAQFVQVLHPKTQKPKMAASPQNECFGTLSILTNNEDIVPNISINFNLFFKWHVRWKTSKIL